MSYTQQPHAPPGDDDRMDTETVADDDSVDSMEIDPLADDEYLHSDSLTDTDSAPGASPEIFPTDSTRPAGASRGVFVHSVPHS